jgi:hypothetical protein
MSPESGILSANLRLLEQCLVLIDELPDPVWAGSSASGAPDGATPVGPHFRHVLEHYSCFLAGLPGRRIDYDSRPREAAIETDRDFACDRIRELIGALESCAGEDLAAPAAVHLECDAGDEPASWSESTVGRELHFLLSHTVHHFALIGLLLGRHGIDPGAEFGVAPSTLKFRRERAACAPQPG